MTPHSTIIDASIYNGILYVLNNTYDNSWKYVSISLGNMQFLNEVPIPNSIAVARIYKDSIYYIQNRAGNISYAKLSLTDKNAKPIIHEITYKIDSKVKPESITKKLEIYDNHILFSYTKDRDFKKRSYQFNVVLIDLNKNTFLTKTLKGFTWSILYMNDQVYAFKAIHSPKYNYQVETLTVLDKNLTSEKELITYFPSEWNNVLFLVSEDNDNLAMIGSYQYSKTRYGNLFWSVFIADYNLK
jgi:hypothetical protein